MEKRFVVDQKVLLNLLNSMQPICTKRTALDATGFILFQVGHKELILKGTDLEISLQANCQLEEASSFTDVETFLISGKRIFEIVKELSGKLTFEIKINQLVINSGTISLSLNLKNAQEFPPFPERIENLMHLDAQHFLKMLDSVAFLIPQNNANQALNGLLMELSPEQLIMTTTDGHCLAQVVSPKYTLSSLKSWLLPRRAILELKKILELNKDETVFLGICGNQLVFSGEAFNFFTKLLAAAFPQYKPILDKTAFVASSIEKGAFTGALRRSACLLSGQFLATKFSFSTNKLQISMNNKEVGTLDEELTIAEFASKKLDIRFYSPYILSGLQSFSDDNLTFYLKSGTKPILFESVNSDLSLTYLVMPVAQSTNAE